MDNGAANVRVVLDPKGGAQEGAGVEVQVDMSRRGCSRHKLRQERQGCTGTRKSSEYSGK